MKTYKEQLLTELIKYRDSFKAETVCKMPYIEYKENKQYLTGLDNRTGTTTFLLLETLRLMQTTTQDHNLTIYAKRDTPLLIINKEIEVLIAPRISEDLTEQEAKF